LQLAEKIIDLTGSKSNIEYKPLPGDDPQQRRPDITLAKEKLGWEPTVRLEDGLHSTIEYFSSII
jgi:UDP-glucuronate decarboxylase